MNSPTTARIPALPDTISRDQIREVCNVLGFDPMDVKTIHVEPEMVSVEMFAKHPEWDGRILAGDKYLKFHASIPVLDDEADQ